MPKGLPSISSRTRLTMMLGEVPTSVISPPSSAANDIGIRKTEGGVLFFFAIWNAEGISIASAPTFLTSADAKPTEAVSTTSWVLTRLTRRETRSEEHTYELQSLMRIPYAGFCLKKKTPTEK